MRNQAVSRRASSLLEFTFVGIPLMFVLVSIFEITRGMWMFNTLAHSVKEGVRLAVVHGNNCVVAPNNCPITAAQICQQMRNQGPGLDPARVIAVTFESSSRTMIYPNLSDCELNQNCSGCTTAYFPSRDPGPTIDDGGSQGSRVEIRAKYRFDSALAFYWTGSRGFTFGRIYLPATAKERIRY